LTCSGRHRSSPRLGLIGSPDDFDLCQHLTHAGSELRPLIAAAGIEFQRKRVQTEQAGQRVLPLIFLPAS
jgi:hypothetical protein